MRRDKLAYIFLLALIPTIIGASATVDFTISRTVADSDNYVIFEDHTGTDQFIVNQHGFPSINGTEYVFNATHLEMNENQLAGSMTCSNGEILEYNSATDNWDCGTDNSGGGGEHTLLNSTSHTDTVTQTVSRGSLVAGNASPAWDELVIGTTDFALVSNGTNPEWGQIVNASVSDSADIGWSKISKAGSSIHELANVTSAGCAAGQILEASGGSWICGNDDTGAGGTITGEGVSDRVAVWNGTSSINSTANLVFDFSENELRVGNVEHSFNATFYDIDTNQIAGSMGCTDTQIIQYNSTSGTWECEDAPTGGSGQTYARVIKKADETVNNSSTFQDDDELTVSLSANKTYGFLMVLIHDSETTPDIKYAFSLPSGASGIMTAGTTWSSTNAVSQWNVATAQVVATFGNPALTPVAGTFIIAGTGGDVTLQWAQNTADVSDTKVLEGSYLVVWEETA